MGQHTDYYRSDSQRIALNRTLVKRAVDKGIFNPSTAVTVFLNPDEVLAAWNYAQTQTQYLAEQPGHLDTSRAEDRIFGNMLAAMACAKAGVIDAAPEMAFREIDERVGIIASCNKKRHLIVGTKKGCFPLVLRTPKTPVLFCTITSVKAAKSDDGACHIYICPDNTDSISVTVLGTASFADIQMNQDPELDYDFNRREAAFYGYDKVRQIVKAERESHELVVSAVPADVRARQLLEMRLHLESLSPEAQVC